MAGVVLPERPGGTGRAPGPSGRVREAASAPAHVEETGPVFLDEEPPDEPARPEPAAAWQADTSRQGGFGGERDHRVSWGGGGPDPRAQAAEPPAPSADPRLPGARQPAEKPPADSTMTIRPQRDRSPEQPGPARGAEGPGAGPRTPGVQPQPQPLPPVPYRPQPSVQPQPQPQPQAQPQAHPQPQAQPRAQPQPQAQAPGHVPAPAPGPGGGSASWAQQVHQLAQPGEPEQPPVVPWKPPTADPFLRMAQAQAAARPAGLGKRFAARLIDSLVLGTLVGAVAVPMTVRAIDHIDAKIEAARQTGQTVTVWLVDATTAVHLGTVLAALLILGALYEALPTARWGRTLGKRVCGLKVVDIESHEPPGFGAALRRWLVYGVLGLLAVGVVNVVWGLFDRPWRQCWHDKAAHTFVTAA
ncbi:RDD family protein [Streptomyces sp. NPDC001985]|uniref:RDD family protein n=1 Tax=Streptomyces sp. NPDC001985 TaxID=3154406 RepID=UPI00333308B5